MKFAGVIRPILLIGVFLAGCNSTNPGTPSLSEIGTPVVETAASVQPTSTQNATLTPETTSASSTRNYEEYEIITLLPRDGIPAIDDPEFLTISEADTEYAPDELILGVEFNGEARAYSVPLLSRHEIVNDTVGGVKIAVTW